MTDEAKRIVEWLRVESCNSCVFQRLGDCQSIDSCVNREIADLIESLAAELEHVKQERDALLKEIKHVSFPLCITCKHRNGVHCRKVFYEDGKRALEALCVTACAHYLWRGVQEADNAEND